MKTWTVIAVTMGDGEGDYGFRVWSHTFYTHAAADTCASWMLDQSGTRVKIVEDEQ